MILSVFTDPDLVVLPRDFLPLVGSSVFLYCRCAAAGAWVMVRSNGG